MTSLLTDMMQDAATTFDALWQIREVMSVNKPLAKTVNLVVKDKSQNEKDRFENLLYYVLDFQTLKYLEGHLKEWLADPSLFDNTIKSSYWAFFRPETRAISELLNTEQDNV